ncbi:SAM-dependent methyltransferase [Azospirillum halopraeferens]|uniref:SAM-dependent methyltransferase n=1 Tax=Azospirillum halopraeferens TaxID=34010 RepID=UPI00041E5540|nr:cyclopropane-fatty-acyl-phospholipid synthase family protein [Azospirillum halopraeferens]
MTELTAAAPPRWRALLPARNLWTAAFLRLASRIGDGALDVTTPDGRSHRFGPPDGVPRVSLALDDPAAARRLLLGGDIAFAEAYADGLWRTSDLPGLIALALRNEGRPGVVARGTGAVRLANRLFHRLRANTRRGSRRNIAFHYDLGNEFYGLWLDRGMHYSSALYTGGGETLEEAQEAKLRRAADLLDVTPGQRVLEIGCGWGGMAEHLARRRGARVVGITLSREQLALAQERLAAERRAGTVDLQFRDYRDVTGTFDRIVSIEMIEAVGEEHWPRYFGVLRDRLEPGGTAVIQAITIADDRFAAYRRGCDFIQRHIFPGGMLPCPAAMRAQAARAGLEVKHVEMFGASYAATLAEWRRRFHAAWPEVARRGFDERFRRLWDYYLAYCEAGFRTGVIDVGFWRLRRPAAGP